MSNSHTNIAELIGELNAGIYEQQINSALSDIAAHVCETGKEGQLTLTFKVKQIADSSQVSIEHSLKSVVPKLRGKVTEEHSTQTPLHVGRAGTLTIFPDKQQAMDMGAGAATGRTDSIGSREEDK
ncbi:hypothetical protein [Algiphilus aromaticivorans]|uniref:hypothetical protein n=1 Tax=Algiphilus aromaticivorans TaxID=382454 RepID=UPI0018DB3B73|nr:hypothetical protein [Algiphilus aromaticivorans]